MSLTGTEILFVLPVAANSSPAASTMQTTTSAIAALAAATVLPPIVNTAISTAGAGTLTAAAIDGGLITRTGPGGDYSDTLDTAANIIAGLTAFVTGESAILRIKNNTAFNQTILTAAGVTLTGSVVVPQYSMGEYLVSITSGSTVTVLGVGAYPIGATGTAGTAGFKNIVASGTINGITLTSSAGTTLTTTAGQTYTFPTTTATLARTDAANTFTGTQTITTLVATTVNGNTITAGTGVLTLAAAITATGPATSGTLALTAPPPVAVGSSLSITAAMSGAPILLNTAGGSTATLPAATGTGNTYRFIVSVSTTSAAHKILTVGTDYIIGIAMGYNGSTAKVFGSPAATNRSIQMPNAGTQPSGGIIGDYFDFVDIGAALWECKSMYQGGTTPTTPFSSATS